MFAFFIISFFIHSKSKSVQRREQLQCLQLMPRGSSPWGGFYWVCSNKHIPGMKRNREQPPVLSPHHRGWVVGGCCGCRSSGWAAHAQCRLSCGAGPAAGQPSEGRALTPPPQASAPGFVPLYPTRAASGWILWGCVTLPTVCRHLG